MGVNGNGGKAFDEVKRLLGRLDRNIDEARTRRLGPEDEPPAKPAASPRPIGQSAPPAPVSPSRSKYGRAKPLRGSDAPAPNAWQRPVQGGDDTLIG